MRFLGFLSFILFIVIAEAKVPQDCIDWFEKSKLSANTNDCEVKCAIETSGMDSVGCSDFCSDFCTVNPVSSSTVLGKFVYYPGLTPEERKLVQAYPKMAVKVFVQKTKAESASARNFPEQGLSDESDAFRHFMWAGLLTKEIGFENAKKFLDAHEANPLQDVNEKKMDDFNNKMGQSAAKELIRSKKWNEKRFQAEGLKLLRDGRLKVLNPGLKIPKEPQ